MHTALVTLIKGQVAEVARTHAALSFSPEVELHLWLLVAVSVSLTTAHRFWSLPGGGHAAFLVHESHLVRLKFRFPRYTVIRRAQDPCCLLETFF